MHLVDSLANPGLRVFIKLELKEGGAFQVRQLTWLRIFFFLKLPGQLGKFPG